MPARKDFAPGEFCWIDLMAHDLEAAEAWYGQLFGWQSFRQETGGPPYSFFMQGEAGIGGAGQMMDEMKAQGIPPVWNSYVLVDDCAASERRAAELGATVNVPTMEVSGHGKLCFITDPSGTSIALWQSLNDEGSGLLVGEPNGLCWNELLCRDLAAARDFYGKLFGWEFADMPMGEMTYTMIKVNGQDAGGIMAMQGPQFDNVPNHWAVYFAVADCQAMADKIAASGGSVLVPPTPIPVGTFSVAQDPQGGGFSIIQLNPA